MQKITLPDLKGMTLNRRIAIVRKNMGFTQKELSEFFDIKSSTYAQMERKGIITCNFLKRFCDFFDIDIRLMIYGELPQKMGVNKIIKKPKVKIKPAYNSNLTLTPREKNMIKLIRSFRDKKREDFYNYLEEFRDIQ